MPIKIIKGDMVESYKNNELDAYAHQANCFCRMGRGIAPLLAKANPEVREVDNATVVGDRAKLGNISIAVTEGLPVLYNVYGQYHWSKYKEAPNRNTEYNALRQGLLNVKLYMQKSGLISLGLPLIGCGLAGGNWEVIVLPMIKEIFNDSGVDVTVFVL